MWLGLAFAGADREARLYAQLQPAPAVRAAADARTARQGPEEIWVGTALAHQHYRRHLLAPPVPRVRARHRCWRGALLLLLFFLLLQCLVLLAFCFSELKRVLPLTRSPLWCSLVLNYLHEGASHFCFADGLCAANSPRLFPRRVNS